MDSSKVSLAIAPIAWTNDDMPDLGAENTFEQCVSEMALAGYTGTEVGRKYPKDPAVLKQALDLRGLQVCNKWFSSFLASKDYREVEQKFIKQLDFLEQMGSRVVGPAEQGLSIQGMIDVPLEEKPVFTDEQWDKFTSGMNALGRIAADRGFKLCFHHHMGTGCQTMEEVDRFLDATDPGLVWLLYDSGHFACTGDDPVEAVKKYASRIGHVHLKDLRRDVHAKVISEKMSFLQAVRAGVFTVPGDGSIDFPSIFKVLEDSEYQGWMVVEAEQDPALANPLEYALKAREYIRRHTGL